MRQNAILLSVREGLGGQLGRANYARNTPAVIGPHSIKLQRQTSLRVYVCEQPSKRIRTKRKFADKFADKQSPSQEEQTSQVLVFLGFNFQHPSGGKTKITTHLPDMDGVPENQIKFRPHRSTMK